jgi:hypothetical protein
MGGVAFLRKDAIVRYVLQSPLTWRESETISSEIRHCQRLRKRRTLVGREATRYQFLRNQLHG